MIVTDEFVNDLFTEEETAFFLSGELTSEFDISPTFFSEAVKSSYLDLVGRNILESVTTFTYYWKELTREVAEVIALTGLDTEEFLTQPTDRDFKKAIFTKAVIVFARLTSLCLIAGMSKNKA